jgi:hypothetical protein
VSEIFCIEASVPIALFMHFSLIGRPLNRRRRRYFDGVAAHRPVRSHRCYRRQRIISGFARLHIEHQVEPQDGERRPAPAAANERMANSLPERNPGSPTAQGKHGKFDPIKSAFSETISRVNLSLCRKLGFNNQLCRRFNAPARDGLLRRGCLESAHAEKLQSGSN